MPFLLESLQSFYPWCNSFRRERVKRAKKAEATQGVIQESSALSGKEIHKESNGKAQKPDLTQISKGLPDGWQVC
jgi:hypothetical protein